MTYTFVASKRVICVYIQQRDEGHFRDSREFSILRSYKKSYLVASTIHLFLSLSASYRKTNEAYINNEKKKLLIDSIPRNNHLARIYTIKLKARRARYTARLYTCI